MRALQTERGALTLPQVAVPTAAVAERRRGGAAARRGDIPAAGDVGRLAVIQLHGPAADRTRTVVGHCHVHLVTVAPDAARRYGATVRGECLAGQ